MLFGYQTLEAAAEQELVHFEITPFSRFPLDYLFVWVVWVFGVWIASNSFSLEPFGLLICISSLYNTTSRKIPLFWALQLRVMIYRHLGR